ncbi:MAG: phospholipid carrier-dependent glycosyltransferase [Chthoniobacterales bacterium]
MDRDEPRFAEATREMRERGDYVVPFFNNSVRFDKPPLTYWCQLASYRIFGENDFAARFPTAVAAAATALVLLAWGSRIGAERVGWLAAIIFTLCLQTFIHGKAAVADMWLVLFVTAAHWAGYELLRPAFSRGDSTGGERPATAWWWLFYAALALAFLAKGPIGWTPLLTVAASKFFLPNLRLHRQFGLAAGVAFTLALVGFWGIPALLRTNGEFFRVGIGHHVVERSLATMEGHGGNSLGMYVLTLPLYFLTLFLSFFPWSLQLPWLARQLRKGRDARDLYLLTGSAIVFLIFTLVKTKLPHYTLPAFPLLALLLARHLAPVTARANRAYRTAFITGTVLLAIALFAFPLAKRLVPSAQLFEQASADLRPEMQIGAVEYVEPSIVWYFRGRAKGWLTSLPPKNARSFMAEPGARCLILPTSLAASIFPDRPREWRSYATRGWNIVKGRRVDLTLLIKSA